MSFCTGCLEDVEFIYKQVSVHIKEVCPQCGKYQRFVQKEEIQKKGLVVETDPTCMELF